MPPDIDWDAERAAANSHDQRSLIALARAAGYDVSATAGKGSHAKVSGLRLSRPVIIPNKVYRRIARDIIRDLERGSS